MEINNYNKNYNNLSVSNNNNNKETEVSNIIKNSNKSREMKNKIEKSLSKRIDTEIDLIRQQALKFSKFNKKELIIDFIKSINNNLTTIQENSSLLSGGSYLIYDTLYRNNNNNKNKKNNNLNISNTNNENLNLDNLNENQNNENNSNDTIKQRMLKRVFRNKDYSNPYPEGLNVVEENKKIADSIKRVEDFCDLTPKDYIEKSNDNSEKKFFTYLIGFLL